MFLIQNSSYLNKASIVKHPVEKFRENEQQEEGFSYGTFSVHIRLQTSHTTCLMLLLLLATLRCYDRILPLWSRETRGCSVHEPNCNSCQGLNWRGANIYLLASSPLSLQKLMHITVLYEYFCTINALNFTNS